MDWNIFNYHWDCDGKNMNIGIDMDGVIVDFVGPICKQFGLKEEDITSFKFEDAFSKELADKINVFYSWPYYFYNLLPYEGAMEFLERIKNHNLFFISSPNHRFPHTYMDKMKWIHKWCPHMARNTVLACNKAIINVDVLIDDYPINLISNQAKIKILMERPWNRENTFGIVASNYNEIEQIIQRGY